MQRWDYTLGLLSRSPVLFLSHCVQSQSPWIFCKGDTKAMTAIPLEMIEHCEGKLDKLGSRFPEVLAAETGLEVGAGELGGFLQLLERR